MKIINYEYNEAGLVAKETNALGQTKAYEYNALLELSNIKDKEGIILTRSFDRLGRVIKEKRRGSPEQSYEYDSIGRIKKEWSAGELQAEYEYGVYGKTLTVKDAMGNAYVYELDEFGLVKKEINRLGVYQEFGYDAEDRLKQKTKFDGALIKTVCDAKENTRTEEYADGTTRIITRDIKGNIIRIQSEAGTTEYHYDAAGHCIEQKEVNPAQTITYEYDAAGNVIKLTGKERSEVYESDARGRVVKIKDGAGIQKLKIEYDALNRIIKIEYPNDISEQRAYTSFGDVEKIWVKDTHKQLVFAEAYIYDSEERLTLSINDKNEIKQYFYDEQYRIREVLSSLSTEILTTAKFEAQRAGLNIEGATIQGETVWLTQNQKETLYAILKDVKLSIQYELEKPFTVWKEQYGYDANGNRTTKTTAFGRLKYNYDSENRLLSAGKITYTYDANGNLLREDEGSGVKKEFTYTAFDRIKTSRVYFGGEPNVSLSNTYRYDGLQRRVLQEDKSQKTLRSVYVQTSLSVLNEWEVHRDGSAITNRQIGSRQYFYAAGELYSIKEYRLPNSGIEYFYKDRQGSIKANASGEGESASE